MTDIQWGKWLIHGPKLCKDNQSQRIEYPCRISYCEHKHGARENYIHVFIPVFSKKVHGENHHSDMSEECTCNQSDSSDASVDTSDDSIEVGEKIYQSHHNLVIICYHNTMVGVCEICF